MSESQRKAVFLSYASQDVAAAKKIADSLRGAGVEVWLDAEGGLEHGDEWDAKIRRQIKECLLFMPLISANTQAREEGYFRIEWELAAERSIGIASGVAFLLPVLIDSTREPDALVPDRFRKVQWTRIPNGEMSPEVLTRLLKLWSHRAGMVAHAANPASSPALEPGAASPPSTRKGALAPVAAVLLLLGAALAGYRYFAHAPATQPAPASPAAASTASTPQKNPELGALTERVHAIVDAVFPNRADFEVAQELAAKALQLDPSDARGWVAAADVDIGFEVFAYDRTPKRASQAQYHAQQAVHLDPTDFEARRVRAAVLIYCFGNPSALEEAEPILQQLLSEKPNDRRALLAQGYYLEGKQRWEDARVCYHKAGDLWAEIWAYFMAGDMQHAYLLCENARQQAKSDPDKDRAQRTDTKALMQELTINLRAREDLDAAQATLSLFTDAQLQGEELACTACDVWLMRHEPAKVVEFMDRYPNDWLLGNEGAGPYRAIYSARALEALGSTAAARYKWQQALSLVEQHEKAGGPDDNVLEPKALILAHLGRTDEAEATLTLLNQLQGHKPGEMEAGTSPIHLALGHHDSVIAFLPSLMSTPFSRIWYHAYLRFDPVYDPVRQDPRFQKILRDYLPSTAKPL